MSKKVSEAVNVLKAALKKDYNYRASWEDNISMAFQDAYRNKSSNMVKGHVTDTELIMEMDEIREIANCAAHNFIDILLA